jgi:hypothetical protein
MSQLFYDSFITLKEIERAINNIDLSNEEKQELWHLIDQLTHQRIMHTLLHHLPHQHHQHLLLLIKEKPHDTTIIEFVKENSEHDIEARLQKESENIVQELLELLNHSSTN